MAQPPGYADNIYLAEYVCKPDKAIYGLKQASRAWNLPLKSDLVARSFVNSKVDTSLFIHSHDTSFVLLLVYVDVILTGNDNSLLLIIIKDLDGIFALNDLGRLSYFLGIQVDYLACGLLLSQFKYITGLLHKFGMENVNPLHLQLLLVPIFL